MARPERLLAADAAALTEFATGLRALREQAGRPGYRTMSTAVGASVSTLANAAGGVRLPTLAATIAYVTACGGDVEEWTQRWREVAAELAEGRGHLVGGPPGDGRGPYLGLATFQPGDTDRFFGRDRLVGELVGRLGEHRLVGVIGPSGSGKSSLLRAGLLPAVGSAALPGSDGWRAELLVPGQRPLAALAEVLDDAEDAPLLLVVDQFEEVFTLSSDPRDQAEFVDVLTTAAHDRDVRVVLGVRADFYAHCTRHSTLLPALQDAVVVVGPMTAGELAEVIARPAAAAGLSVERALTAAVIRDAGDEPGALPLVSHALRETWLRRNGTVLSLAGYQSAGGVAGAVARTAEQAYEELDDKQQRAAQDLLVRMCALGEGTEDIRRRVRYIELDLDRRPESTVVLNRLATARLITLDTDTVEIAHEALIRSWPRLRDWLAADREGLRIHRQLTESAAAWDELGRDPGALYRGARLASVREWLARANDQRLTIAEQHFLDTSTAAESAERNAAIQRQRRLRRLAGALAAALVLALLAAGTAVSQTRIAERERRVAVAGQRAAEALGLATDDVPHALAAAIAGYRAADTLESRSALLSLASTQTYHGQLTGHTGTVNSVSFNPDGTLLATASQDQTIALWSVPQRRETGRLVGHTDAIRMATFNPDGTLIASAGRDGEIIVWDVATHAVRHRWKGHDAIPNALTFSPGGALLASADKAGRTLLWDTTSWTLLRELPVHGGKRSRLAFTPDGRYLATTGDDGTVKLWRTTTGEHAGTLIASPGVPVYSVAIRPDGRQLAAAGMDGTIRTWDLPADPAATAPTSTPRYVMPGHLDGVGDLTYSSDGDTNLLVSAGYDHRAIVWDADRGAQVTELRGHTRAVVGVAISPDSRFTATAAEDGTVLIWDQPQSPLHGHVGWVTELAPDPDGRTVLSTSADGTARLWDVAQRRTLASWASGGAELNSATYGTAGQVAVATSDGQIHLLNSSDLTELPSVAAGAHHTDRVESLAYSPDGTNLLSGSFDATVKLWQLNQGTVETIVQGPIRVDAVAFSPDGRLFATGDGSGLITLHDAATRAELHTWTTGSSVNDLAFSQDSTTLAAAEGDGTVGLWDVANRTQLAALRQHTGQATTLEFSPDGRYLASGGEDQTVVIWTTANRRPYASLTAHTDIVLALTWTPDGRRILSSGGDHTIISWIIDPTEATRRAADRLIANFPTAH
ncbi:MAG: hypothetical protein L0Y54_15685 [Sporichthyaceae bacterium]|nr:hypothetical protein [Sporichthyaceae bacterium]